MYNKQSFFLFLTFFLTCQSNEPNEDQDGSITSEFCGYERLMLRCPGSSVLLIQRALYGRMQSGRCISSEYYNTLGCYEDVLPYLSSLCSGKSFCSLLVATVDLIVQPCHKDFKPYLQVTHQCIKDKS